MNIQVPYSHRDPKDIFVCQIADPTKVEEWVATSDRLDPSDPKRHWCAMCCVRMLLLAEGMPAPSLEDLFESACQRGVYRRDERLGWRGAYHQELADFINTVRILPTWHERQAFAHRGLPMTSAPNNPFFSLEALVRQGCYALLSVHPNIRLDTTKAPPMKRGHLVFIYGVGEFDGETFFLLNNSAGFQSNGSQIGVQVSASRLKQVSSGDCVLVKSRFSRLLCE